MRMEESEEEYWSGKDFEDYSKPYEEEGKLRWAWRKGVCLGKKMVVTGVVVSSAPFVLPPLMALSALGFAFSVPAGFVFATYACTDKLMDKLLTMPSPPAFLEASSMSSDEEYYRAWGYDADEGYEDYVDLESEEKEYEDDTRKEVEMRIELAEKGDRDTNDNYGQVSTDKDDTRMRMTQTAEEGGYEEDVGEYMEDDQEQPLDSSAIPSIVEGIREAEDEISLMEREGVEMPRDSLGAFVVEAEVGGENENNVEQVTEEMAFVPPSDMVEIGHKRKLADIEEDELRNETTGLIEQIRDEGKDDDGKRDNLAKEISTEDERKGEIPMKDLSQDRGNKNLFVIPEEVKPAGISRAEQLSKTVNKRSEKRDESGVMQEQLRPVVEKKLVVNVKPHGGHTATDVRQESGSHEKLGTFMLSDVVARDRTDERRFDLHHDATDAAAESSDSLNQSPKVDEQPSDDVVGVAVEYHEVRIESTVLMSEPAEIVTAASNKVSVDEEKIWEQIKAMRSIVGYKTTPHPSCMEELKCLYEFTGVEPPASVKEVPDLADVNEKLHFLMSIVGVK